MYPCELNLIIISGETRLEAAIKQAEIPEDCAISVSTKPSLSEKPKQLDTAVIFDGAAAFFEGIANIGERVLSVAAVSAAELDDLCDAAVRPDDIWVLDENSPDQTAIFFADRLIARMKTEFDFRMQTICMTTAFDSIPDLVWFKDVKGAHLCVNNGFCDAVAKTKEQIYKKGHYYIWDIPKEEYAQGDYVCLESEEVVMNARETCLFDEKVKTKKGMRQFKTYKSALIDEDGKIFGTCGVANDVTAQHNINSELEVILDSMPFAVLIVDEHENVLSVNRLFSEFFPEFDNIVGTNVDSWKNSVMHGKLADGEVLVQTENGMKALMCRVKPIYSIFDKIIGNVIILTDVTNVRIQQKQTAHSANTDLLTGLYNRKYLFEYAESIKHEKMLCAVMIELKNLSGVNACFGHEAGDRVLTRIAEKIRSTFVGDCVARFSGNDFLVLVSGYCSVNELEEQAYELLDALRADSESSSEPGLISAKVGIAESDIPEDGEQNIDMLISKCEKALESANNAGAPSVCVFSE